MTELNVVTFDQVIDGLGRLGVAYELIGPPRVISKICSLLFKEPQGLYYYSGDDPKIIGTLTDSVVICKRNAAHAGASTTCIAVDSDPQLVFYKLCALLFDTRPLPGIHPSAVLHPEAEIGSDVHIGPFAVIGRCIIGSGSIIHGHVVIMDGSVIGNRVVIEPNSCIGATGVAWIWDGEGERIVLPQIGGVLIGDDVFIGSDVSVVRGMFNESTTIGAGTMIAHGSKIGHSAILGVHCHLANNVSIAGSVVIGDRCFLGSGCSVRPHARLAQGTIVGVGAAVIKDVMEPNTTVAGVPATTIPAKGRQRGVPPPANS